MEGRAAIIDSADPPENGHHVDPRFQRWRSILIDS